MGGGKSVLDFDSTLQSYKVADSGPTSTFAQVITDPKTMSDTAAAAPKRNLSEEEVLVGMPPEKKTAADEQCDCARCELREEISAMVLGALEVLKAYTEPDASTVDEEKTRRRTSYNVRRGVYDTLAQLSELLPDDPRLTRTPPTYQYGSFLRGNFLRRDYNGVRTECDLGAGLSSRTMFRRFHSVVRWVLDRVHHEMYFETPLRIHDVTVECGLTCAIVMQNCEGIASCAVLYEQLRSIATALFVTVEELKTSPPPPSPCRATQRRNANVTPWVEEDRENYPDIVPGEPQAAAN
jgi:hypothetical protein